MVLRMSETSTTWERVLLNRLSPERLTSYLQSSGGDLSVALRLYEWNCAVSSAVFEVLGDVEVVVRNALHRELATWHSRNGFSDQWYDNSHGLLSPRAVEDVGRAKERLRKKNKLVTPGAVVAELSFGFWRFLLTKQYTSTLWPAVGSRAFPNLASSDARKLWSRMARLHDLRNRIAHHEPIHWRHVDRDLTDCMVTIGAVCATTEMWSRSRSRVEEVLLLRP